MTTVPVESCTNTGDVPLVETSVNKTVILFTQLGIPEKVMLVPDAATCAWLVITLPPITGVLMVGLVSVLLVSVCDPLVVTRPTPPAVAEPPIATLPDASNVMLAVAELGSWMIVVLRVAVMASMLLVHPL